MKSLIFGVALVAASFSVVAPQFAAANDGADPTVRPQGVDASGQAAQARGLFAAATAGVGPAVTRAEIIARAQTWADARVPYSQAAYRGGYRTDCSGYISMAWKTNRNYWTGDLHTIGVKIGYNDLRPGDMLLYHNPANPTNGSHVVLFDHWTGAIGGDFVIFEQTPPSTKHRTWSAAGYSRSRYMPYRYVNVVEGGGITGTQGDLDNAGRADMLAMMPGGDLYVYPNTGNGWGTRRLVCGGCGDVDSVNVADLNLDGKADLVARFRDGNIWVYPNTGGPGVTAWGTRYLTCGLCGSFDAVNTGDVNNDGRADLVVREASTGNIYLYPNTGAGWGSRTLICGLCGSYDAINLGDLNLDGRTDLVMRDTAGTIWAYPGSGSGWGNRYVTCAGCGGFNAVNLGDHNNDGRTDLVMRDGAGTIWVYPNTGNGWGNRYPVCSGCGTWRDIN